MTRNIRCLPYTFHIFIRQFQLIQLWNHLVGGRMSEVKLHMQKRTPLTKDLFQTLLQNIYLFQEYMNQDQTNTVFEYEYSFAAKGVSNVQTFCNQDFQCCNTALNKGLVTVPYSLLLPLVTCQIQEKKIDQLSHLSQT